MDPAAKTYSVELLDTPVASEADIDRAFAKFGADQTTAVMILADVYLLDQRNLVVASAARYRVPTMFPFPVFPAVGGLMSYGGNLPDKFRQAAGYVDRILRGENPGDLPVQMPTKYELVISGEETMSQTDVRPVTLSTYPFELLHFRWFGPIGPALQITVVAALYVATTLLLARDVRLTGKMMGYDPDVWILFVPITEEILFRGLILGALEIAYGPVRAVAVSSLLFGLWHLKNVFWLTDYQLIHQMLYTGLIFGPITAMLALKTRTIWPGVILHYLNNLLIALIR